MPRRKKVEKQRQSRPTECIVCGDEATGYNYDAPSCASCKAFFRRVVIKNQVFVGCMRSGLCATYDTYGPCRACRYDKCIKGGMNPLAVTCTDTGDTKPVIIRRPSTDEEKPSTSKFTAKCETCATAAVKESVECQTEAADCGHVQNEHQNLQSLCHSCETKRKEAEDVPCDPGTSSQGQDAQELRLVPNPHRIENKLERIMQSVLVLEEAHQTLRISKYTPKLIPGLNMDDLAAGPSKLGVKFGPMHSRPYETWSMPIVPYECIIKHRMAMDLTNFDYDSRKLWMFQDVTYSIEFMKALSIYNLLDDSSKKVLLASALTCSNYTAAYYSYSHHSDRTCFPDGSVMTWTSELQVQSPDSTRFHTGLIAAMKEAQLDTREYTLLKIILICNPLLHGLHPHDITLLQHEKERVTKTLLSYVLARRGMSEGPAHFAKILSIADVATRLTSWQKSQCILIVAMNLYKNYTPFDETVFHSQ